jgi:membrane-associated phospholipid phosphatase
MKAVSCAPLLPACLLFCAALCVPLSAQETESVLEHAQEAKLSFGLIFHDIGKNALRALSYNHGLNAAGAVVGTWAFIESGADLWWRNLAYNTTGLAEAGLPALYAGFAIPVITPLFLYVAGAATYNTRLKITALALTQSLLLTFAVQTPLKMITGRASPGIITNPAHTRGLPGDDHSGVFHWFNMDFLNGWPSGHTANAFSAAATIAELYKDDWVAVAGAYTYAAAIGLGVSVNVHWASEVFAGALIGWAIGKTVGKSFARLLRRGGIIEDREQVMLFVNPYTVGVCIYL